MEEYQKIETLFKFDNTTKKFTHEFYNPIVEYLRNCKWIGTEKIDGTNVRVFWNGKSFEFGARTNEGDLPKPIRELLQEKFNYDMEVTFEQKFGNKEVYIFFEGYAGKIQGGAYTGAEKLIAYDIKIGKYYLDRYVAKDIIESLGFNFVPMMEFNTLDDCIQFVKTHEQSIIQPESKMEGLVCLPTQRIYDHQGNRIIVKIKIRDLNKQIQEE